MEELFSRFSHLPESIFDQLNDESLANCRLICQQWQDYLEDKKFFQIRMISATVANFHEVGDAWKRYFNIASSSSIRTSFILFVII